MILQNKCPNITKKSQSNDLAFAITISLSSFLVSILVIVQWIVVNLQSSIVQINCSKMNPQQQQTVPITDLHQHHYCYAPSTVSFTHPSDSATQPPGTHPLPISTAPFTYGFETTESQNWIVLKADPIGYGQTVGPSHETSVVFGSLSSTWNDTWSRQALTNETAVVLPDQTNVSKQLRCEICQIDCNSQTVYENHISRKKHKRNLLLQANPTNNTLLAKPSNTSVQTNGDIQGKMAVGATTNFKKVCTICNVVCTSLDVYEKHVAGKKHTAKVALMSNNGIGPRIATCKRQGLGPYTKALKKIKVDQSAWCDVCKVICNSRDMYIAHLAGKKHLKNSEKLSKPKIDVGVGTTTSNTSQPSANVIIGPQEKPGMKKPESQKSPERDIEMKKLKVVQGGAAEADVRICIPCNVVCNSQTVYDTHLAGHKHTAMLKKQAEAPGD